METKLPVIERFLANVSSVLIGGALATAFFVADGISVGRSVYRKEDVAFVKRLCNRAGAKLILPKDVMVARSLRKNAKPRAIDIKKIRASDYVVDIGPKTILCFEKEIAVAKTIVWNGPLGYCEVPAFCEGTNSIARAIAKRTGDAITIVGGGDTVPVLESMHLADKFSLLSTGGGALLEYLAGKKLPGLEAVRQG